MKIHNSPANFSEIVVVGDRLRKLSIETGHKYLMCQRGINSVCNIDLSEVVKNIDFNSTDIQVYPPNSGRLDLRSAINKEYFDGMAITDHILITNGAIAAIDMAVQTLDIDEVLVPKYHWGSYLEILKMRGIPFSFYDSFDELLISSENLQNKAVIICDPNNPLGNKVNDKEIIETIEKLNHDGAVVLFDCPYRRVFFDKNTDTMFQHLLQFKNVIIIESFSKSLGLSGQRIGFIYGSENIFIDEINKRILYQTNGTNAFSQILIRELLKSEAGKHAVINFKKQTVDGIKQNITFLKTKNLLAEKFYENSEPVGIFAIVNKSETELLKYNIGSVRLSYFTKTDAEAEKFARICVSIPPDEFRDFFEKVEN